MLQAASDQSLRLLCEEGCLYTDDPQKDVQPFGLDDHDGILSGSDRALALWLIQEHCLASHPDAIMEESPVKICDGLPKNLNGRVIRVDRRKRLANVRWRFLAVSIACGLAPPFWNLPSIPRLMARTSNSFVYSSLTNAVFLA